MVEVKTTYGSNTAIAIGLDVTPLASSATLTAGRESDEIDNTSDKFIDAIVKGKITVGTTPTINTLIVVHAWGSDESLGTTPLDDLDGSDADRTITNSGVVNSMLRVAANIQVFVATSDITYEIAPFSIAKLFGGVMSKFWGLFVTHNTGVALNTTAGNHAFSYNGITYTST